MDFEKCCKDLVNSESKLKIIQNDLVCQTGRNNEQCLRVRNLQYDIKAIQIKLTNHQNSVAERVRNAVKNAVSTLMHTAERQLCEVSQRLETTEAALARQRFSMISIFNELHSEYQSTKDITQGHFNSCIPLQMTHNVCTIVNMRNLQHNKSLDGGLLDIPSIKNPEQTQDADDFEAFQEYYQSEQKINDNTIKHNLTNYAASNECNDELKLIRLTEELKKERQRCFQMELTHLWLYNQLTSIVETKIPATSEHLKERPNDIRPTHSIQSVKKFGANIVNIDSALRLSFDQINTNQKTTITQDGQQLNGNLSDNCRGEFEDRLKKVLSKLSMIICSYGVQVQQLQKQLNFYRNRVISLERQFKLQNSKVPLRKLQKAVADDQSSASGNKVMKSENNKEVQLTDRQAIHRRRRLSRLNGGDTINAHIAPGDRCGSDVKHAGPNSSTPVRWKSAINRERMLRVTGSEDLFYSSTHSVKGIGENRLSNNHEKSTNALPPRTQNANTNNEKNGLVLSPAAGGDVKTSYACRHTGPASEQQRYHDENTVHTMTEACQDIVSTRIDGQTSEGLLASNEQSSSVAGSSHDAENSMIITPKGYVTNKICARKGTLIRASPESMESCHSPNSKSLNEETQLSISTSYDSRMKRVVCQNGVNAGFQHSQRDGSPRLTEKTFSCCCQECCSHLFFY